MCEVHVTFEDVLLGEPLTVQLSCSESSRLFPYYLRQQLHALKRVPPFKQSISKLSDGAYSLKIRDRPAKNLIPYTIHGHYFDEYEIFIDKKDTVMDVKFLLAPLVNHGNKAEDIQLVYIVFHCDLTKAKQHKTKQNKTKQNNSNILAPNAFCFRMLVFYFATKQKNRILTLFEDYTMMKFFMIQNVLVINQL